MIPAAHARAVEDLLPLIEEHRLAVSGQTAAAIYGLTARDTSDLLELSAIDSVHEAAHPRLKGDLERSLVRRHQNAQVGGDTRPDQRGTVDVWRVGDVLCAVVMRDDEERPQLSLEVGIGGLPGGPADVRRTPITPGGGRVATVDQVVAAQQVADRWIAAPEDLASVFDLGLATHRVGAELALSDLPVARRDELALSIERARALLGDGLVRADFVPRARHGLAEAHVHVLTRCRTDMSRSR